MQAEDGLDLRVVERALLDHERRPALLALRRSLLGGLEEEDDGAGEARPERRPAPRPRRGAIVVWASWPQACITPVVWLRNGTSFVSSMGSASMSARSATTRAGPAAAEDPTTPVFATG